MNRVFHGWVALWNVYDENGLIVGNDHQIFAIVGEPKKGNTGAESQFVALA